MPIDRFPAGTNLPPVTRAYTERDVMLYALGVGCGAEHPAYTYERGLKVLPTFAVVPAFPALPDLAAICHLDPLSIVHTEHRIELLAPIPTRATITTTPRIEAIYDRRVAALVVVAMESVDERGTLLFRNTATLYARGAGGFGGERGPAGIRHIPPSRRPDVSVSMTTRSDQALLYRLSGDLYPIHVDPQLAQVAGFPRPILHGLCTFGFVGRALLGAYCGGEPTRFRSLDARFSGPVFPGDILAVHLWCIAPGTIAVRVRTERGGAVLSATAEVLP